VPEQNDELNFEQLLAYSDEPDSDEFVANVMHKVRQERRKRQLVLFIFGLAGAAFGVLGAFLLSDSITRLFSSLPVTGTMQAALLVSAAVAFYVWFMNDDLNLTV
jgi:VIT1/CCC1 family predicted Fe2+/Mn2+ transporter